MSCSCYLVRLVSTLLVVLVVVGLPWDVQIYLLVRELMEASTSSLVDGGRPITKVEGAVGSLRLRYRGTLKTCL